MVELQGNNLPKRQQDLNNLVKGTVRKKVNFDEIRVLEEKSDVDRLFKIDVASEYREINYILETFTSGDSLYISRALKCLWIYEDEYSSFINPEYLHENIFNLMSVKMKVKMLKAIYMHVRNKERALSFYKYCVDNKLQSIALKFLIFTSEEYKLEVLKNRDSKNIDDYINIKQFVGNSFRLAETYLQTCYLQRRRSVIYEFRYLYYVSSEQFLYLLESYYYYYDPPRSIRFVIENEMLSLRMSKDIITKHKERVLKNPIHYFEYLNIKMIVKHSTVEDAKVYIAELLPSNVELFWCFNFYETYKEVIDIIPQNEIVPYLEELFEAKYPNKPFEMSKEFYDKKLYRLFTAEQREAWALEHLKQNREMLGQDQDFLWYQFVNFDLAFKEIKRYISITTNPSKRGEMLNVLINSSKNELDLEKTLNYFYDRHINESAMNKVHFMDKIYDVYNVFKFNDSTWNVYNKILHSLICFLDQFKTISLVYLIIHHKEVPETLQDPITQYFELCNRFHIINMHLQKLTENEIQLVYEYYINLCITNIKEFDGKVYNEENKNKISEIISSTMQIQRLFKKKKEDIPDIIMKYIKLDLKRYEDHHCIEKKVITETVLIRLLKNDVTLLLNKLPEFWESCKSSYELRLTRLMKKLKIYFSNDFAKDALSILEQWLLEKDSKAYSSAYYTIICSIFQIASEDYKLNFMFKYTPEEQKIAHDTVDRHLLTIQEGICQFVHYSRPPVPLQIVQKYIKGDYVPYCLPMFGAYAANLPRPLTIQFVAAILDAPVSIQKHGLRLAFKWFDVEDLKKLILDVWKKTKNVSLRMIIYTSLTDYLEANSRRDVYEVLKILTLNLNEDDQDIIFNLLQNTSKFPAQFRSDFIETSWKAVAKLPEKKLKNLRRRREVIKNIVDNIKIIDKEFCRLYILDEFINFMLFQNNIRPKYSSSEMESLINGKWILAANYITHFDGIEQFNKSWELVSTIIKKCVEMWDQVHDNTFTIRQFLSSFLKNTLILTYWDADKTHAIPMLQNIIKQLEDSLPMSQIYLLYCEFHLLIILKSSWSDPKFNSEDLDFLYSDFAEKLVAFLVDLKQKNLFYASLQAELFEVVSVVVRKMSNNTKLCSTELLLHVCDRLSNVQTNDTFLIALLMMPLKVEDDYKTLWTSVINKAKQFDREEIQALVWHKFVK